MSAFERKKKLIQFPRREQVFDSKRDGDKMREWSRFAIIRYNVGFFFSPRLYPYAVSSDVAKSGDNTQRQVTGVKRYLAYSSVTLSRSRSCLRATSGAESNEFCLCTDEKKGSKVRFEELGSNTVVAVTSNQTSSARVCSLKNETLLIKTTGG